MGGDGGGLAIVLRSTGRWWLSGLLRRTVLWWSGLCAGGWIWQRRRNRRQSLHARDHRGFLIPPPPAGGCWRVRFHDSRTGR